MLDVLHQERPKWILMSFTAWSTALSLTVMENINSEAKSKKNFELAEYYTIMGAGMLLSPIRMKSMGSKILFIPTGNVEHKICLYLHVVSVGVAKITQSVFSLLNRMWERSVFFPHPSQLTLEWIIINRLQSYILGNHLPLLQSTALAHNLSGRGEIKMSRENKMTFGNPQWPPREIEVSKCSKGEHQ